MAAEYARAYAFIEAKMVRVEFMWHGRVDLLFFPRPPEAQALSQASKDRLIREVDMDNPEAKKRDFCIR